MCRRLKPLGPLFRRVVLADPLMFLPLLAVSGRPGIAQIGIRVVPNCQIPADVCAIQYSYLSQNGSQIGSRCRRNMPSRALTQRSTDQLVSQTARVPPLHVRISTGICGINRVKGCGALRDTSWCDPVRRPIASSIPKRAGLVPGKFSGSDALETAWKRCRKYLNF